MDCPIRRRPYPFWVFALDVIYIYIYVCVLYMYIYVCVTCVCVCDMRVCVCIIYYLQITHWNLSLRNQQETLRYCASLYHWETTGVLLEQQVAGGWAYLSIHHHPSIRPSINVSTHLIVLHPYHISIPLSYRFIYTPVQPVHLFNPIANNTYLP